MKAQRIIFSEDESRKYVLFGSKESAEAFGLGQLHSSQIFPFSRYIDDEEIKEDSFILRAVHGHKEGKLAVQVWTANN